MTRTASGNCSNARLSHANGQSLSNVASSTMLKIANPFVCFLEFSRLVKSKLQKHASFPDCGNATGMSEANLHTRRNCQAAAKRDLQLHNNHHRPKYANSKIGGRLHKTDKIKKATSMNSFE
jgi:hypothetical protein